MAYINLNNICTFEGRLSSDPEFDYISPANGGKAFARTKIRIAVEKQLSKEQKQKYKQKGEPTAEFIPVTVIGAKAEFVRDYFIKGDPIKVCASYKTYSGVNKENQKYDGHTFEAVDVGFVIGASKSKSNKQEDSFSNGQEDSSNNEQEFSSQNFQEIDDDDIPF